MPVAVVHNDVLTNDFNQLFDNVVHAPETYLSVDGPPVMVLASAGPFFHQVLPSRSVNLGLSFSAAHWLSTQPEISLPDGFYFCEATGADCDALARLAATDWRAFLVARAAELTPGGRLLVQCVGTDDSGGAPQVTARKLMQAMSDVAREMAADGTLDAQAVDHYILPVYARTVGEARAPLEGRDAVDGFDIETIRVDPVANPYLTKWEADGNADAYGAAYAAFVRGFTESSLRLHLFGAGNGDGDRDVDGLVDEYFSRLRTRFAADPRRDPFEDWTLTVVLVRTAP